MKKTLTLLTSAMLVIATFVACNSEEQQGETNIAVTGVSINPTTASLVIGDTLALTASISPEDATNQAITWASSDNAIATVEYGVVTAIAEGETTITVTTQDGNHTATSDVTVTNYGQPSLPMTGCNTATPGWGAERPGWGSGGLGVISWGTQGNTNIETGSTTVTREGTPPANTGTGTNTQVWSGAVFATACQQKSTLAGGSTGNFNADCRSAQSNLTGHLFTWCAVMRFANQLCPYPWRVPSANDFRRLHWILTGNVPPAAGEDVALVANTYMGTAGTGTAPQIGGTWRGARFTGWSGVPTGNNSLYWSSSEVNATDARSLYFSADVVWPEGSINKAVGLALRCVR